MSYDAEPVGGFEIAERFGVKPDTITTWRQRTREGSLNPPFPEPRWPRSVSTHDAWDWAEVRAWGIATGRLKIQNGN